MSFEVPDRPVPCMECGVETYNYSGYCDVCGEDAYLLDGAA